MRSFRKCGISLAVDESKDEKINIRGMAGSRVKGFSLHAVPTTQKGVDFELSDSSDDELYDEEEEVEDLSNVE